MSVRKTAFTRPSWAVAVDFRSQNFVGQVEGKRHGEVAAVQRGAFMVSSRMAFMAFSCSWDACLRALCTISSAHFLALVNGLVYALLSFLIRYERCGL